MRQLKIGKSITNRDAASLDKYLQDISKLPMINVEEETLLAAQIRSGNTLALEKLVSANLRFVVSVAKQYQNQGISLSDLINEGNVGLIKAASRFDETRGFKFISYAVWWIRQSIIQAISEQSRVVRLPLNKIGILNKIKKARGILEQELERPPSDSEVALLTDISEQEISTTQRSALWHVAMDATLPGQEDFTVLDILHNADEEKPDDGLMLESLKQDIKRALGSLTEKEERILIQYYGIAGNQAMSLDEIGKENDLTRERVRQIKEKAIRKLRNNPGNRHLLTFL
ncbi:MAG: RNA polymerase sigma factor RpoD/SigA [Sediminibacterium sp.]|nr:RNA polymerase sigma factor RpoD/SigA [Sediminibacterium sp.]